MFVETKQNLIIFYVGCFVFPVYFLVFLKKLFVFVRMCVQINLGTSHVTPKGLHPGHT